MELMRAQLVFLPLGAYQNWTLFVQKMKNKKILIHSSGEKVLGVSDYQSNGEIGFPRLLPIEGEPLLSSSADLNGDGLDEILVIKEDKSDTIWSPGRSSEKAVFL